MNRDVLLISFSAFFADLGYQAALAIFPIFLVIGLGAPASTYGIANAIAFGVGAAFGYLGGVLGDRYNYKYVAILGNALIPLISLVGLTYSVVAAVALFSGGWWARNFRSPARRSMLVESTSKTDRSKVFGFLHALDIGGGMLSIALVLVMIYFGISYNSIFLLTIFPIVISTLLLAPTTNIRKKAARIVGQSAGRLGEKARVAGRTYRGIVAATALYGFSSYSLGFPILTIAKGSNPIIGIGSYGVYLGVSAVAGYAVGSIKWLDKIKVLSIIGYALSGGGTMLLGIGYLYGSIPVEYLAVAILGFSLGVIETLEPTIVSFIKNMRSIGRGMGALTGSRSFGIFFANLIMGILYVFSPIYSYTYAAIVSVVAGAMVLVYGRGFDGRR